MTTETNVERLRKLRFTESVAAKSITGQANISLELIAWAVQQAERAQELDARVNRHKHEKYRAFKENARLRKALEQLQEDVSRHGKHGGNIPRDTSFEIIVKIDEALKGESE